MKYDIPTKPRNWYFPDIKPLDNSVTTSLGNFSGFSPAIKVEDECIRLTFKSSEFKLPLNDSTLEILINFLKSLKSKEVKKE